MPQEATHLTFTPRPPPTRPSKRSRPTADIDGEHSCLQKKKRRLRLRLITSRLSPRFSHPATNIVERGWWYRGCYCYYRRRREQQHVGLRKAAILNYIRRGRSKSRNNVVVVPELESTAVHASTEEDRHYTHGLANPWTHLPISTTTTLPCSSSSPPPYFRSSPNAAYAFSTTHAQLPRRYYMPVAPSPLGLSNYDAFDEEEEGGGGSVDEEGWCWG